MDCGFKFEGIEGLAATWEQLVSKILPNNGEPLANMLIDSLNFHNAESEQINAFFEGLKSNVRTNTQGSRVTISIKEYLTGKHAPTNDFKELHDNTEKTVLFDSKNVTSTERQEMLQQYIDYCSEFGTALHECIDSYVKYGKDSKQLENAKKKVFESILNGKKSKNIWGNVKLGSTERSSRFLDSISESDVDQFIDITLNNAINNIVDILTLSGEPHLLTEVVIEDNQALNGSGLEGTIDAITYDDNGNITIYDFKTTANNDVSYFTKLYRYMQLCLYKKMLIEKSIKNGTPLSEGKIKIKTIQITTLTENSKPKLSVESIEPLSVFQGYEGSAVTKTNRLLSIVYPYEGKTISNTEAEQLKDSISKKVSPIISNLGLGRMSVDSWVDYLTDQVEKNKPTFLRHIKESGFKSGITITKWIKDGDIVKGYDATNKLVISKTIKEIAELESKEMSETLNLHTRNIARFLGNKDILSLSQMLSYDKKYQTALLQALEPYIASNYEYIKIPFLEDEYNIITLKNAETGGYSFIVVSDLMNLDHSRTNADHMLTPVLNDQSITRKFKEAKEMPFPNAGNVLTMQAIIAINECKDLISQEPIIIDRVGVVSASNGTHTLGLNLNQFEKSLHLLEYVATSDKKALKSPEQYTNIYSKWQKNIRLGDAKKVLCNLVLDRISTFKLNHPYSMLDTMGSLTIEYVQENIDDLLQRIETEYSPSKNNGDYLDVNSDIGRIYAGLKQIKTMYASGELRERLYKHTKYGLTAAETLGAGFDILKYGQVKTYSFNGMILNGLAQGIDTSVSYSNPDKAVQYYEQVFRQAGRQVTNAVMNMAVEFNQATKKFLRESGKSGFSVAVMGSTTGAYEVLFEQDDKGKVAKNMQLKNPYLTNSDLTDYQREYSEIVLWEINRLRIPEGLLSSKYKEMSYEEFKKSDKFNDYKSLVTNSPEYLFMPLKLKNSTEGLWSNVKSLFSQDDTDDQSKSKARKFCDKIHDRWMQSIQPVLLTPLQKQGTMEDFDEARRHFEYHSPYNKQGENRVVMLNNTPTDEWEKNLNVLTLEYAVAQFEEIYFQRVLKTVGDLLGEIDLMEVMTGTDLSSTKQTLINKLKISVYNQNLVDEELEHPASIVAGIKQVVSFTTLALRPATFVKEMILGIIKNMSTIIADNFVNDVPITMEHLIQAASIVYSNGAFTNKERFAPDDESFGDFRLLGQLNNYYRINDRDLNLYGESVAYDSHGILHWGSRMLYLNTTSPDWFNRLTILTAKMLADGTWEAHSLDSNGRLVYDANKDKRFKRFLSFYSNHKNLENEPKDEEYIISKTRYIVACQQLIKEGNTNIVCNDVDGYGINGTGQLPACYTQQEMDSVKEQIGTLYGFYSSEERANFQKSLQWLLHTQFLTYLPAEIKRYFAKGDLETSVGAVIHQTNPFNGKKLYYHTNEVGLTEVVDEDELTYDERTNPVIEFVKTPQEGLIISTLKTLSQLVHGQKNEISLDQKRRTNLFFFNLLLWALLQALIVGIGVFAAKKAKSSKEAKLQMDTIAITKRILSSVSQELNIIGELESALSSMGISGYDQTKQLMTFMFSKSSSSSREFIDYANKLGFIKDFQLS